MADEMPEGLRRPPIKPTAMDMQDRLAGPGTLGPAPPAGNSSHSRSRHPVRKSSTEEMGISRYESAQRPQVELIECFALASANLEKVLRLRDIDAKEFC
jgi:hypothetical protein